MLKHGDLMAQDEDLSVLSAVGAGRSAAALPRSPRLAPSTSRSDPRRPVTPGDVVPVPPCLSGWQLARLGAMGDYGRREMLMAASPKTA